MQKKAFVWAVAALIMVTAALQVHRGAFGQQQQSAASPGLRLLRDVTYANVDGVDLKLNLAIPTKLAADPAPAVVYVHGGGWSGGDKHDAAGVAAFLLQRGYIVALVNYRLAPHYTWPAQILDVKAAVRYLRAHAGEYHLDPSKIGAWGDSAGGHLVALLGTTDARAGFDKSGGNVDQSSRVEAVVDMYGPTDLTAADLPPAAQQIISSVFVAPPDQLNKMLQKASPVVYVKKGDPPFLILHGDHDGLVPLSQSQEFYDRLKAAGDDVTLVVVKNAGHGFAPTGGPISPTVGELSGTVGDFYDRTLKPADGAKAGH